MGTLSYANIKTDHKVDGENCLSKRSKFALGAHIKAIDGYNETISVFPQVLSSSSWTIQETFSTMNSIALVSKQFFTSFDTTLYALSSSTKNRLDNVSPSPRWANCCEIPLRDVKTCLAGWHDMSFIRCYRNHQQRITRCQYVTT